MMCSGVTVCLWNSSAPLAGNTRFYLQICVCQTVQLTRKPDRLQNLATDAGMCVRCTRHLSTRLATWCSASVTHGQTYHRSRSCWSMEKAVVCMHEDKRTSLWTSTKLKQALFKANTVTTGSFQSHHILRRKTRCFVSFPSWLFKNK